MSCVKRSQLLPNKLRISKFEQGHFGTMSATSSAVAATALFSGDPAVIYYERSVYCHVCLQPWTQRPVTRKIEMGSKKVREVETSMHSYNYEVPRTINRPVNHPPPSLLCSVQALSIHSDQVLPSLGRWPGHVEKSTSG